MFLARIIDAYCASWSDEDASERQALLLPLLDEGATYTDPTVHTVGANELLAHIASIHSKYPGVSIRRTSDVDVHHDIARFAWKFTAQDETFASEGMDVVFFDSRQERMIRIVAFFGRIKFS